MAKRTKEQNRRYYENRVRKARTEGFKGYGQKRRLLEKARELSTTRQAEIDTLRASFPNAVVYEENFEETYPNRVAALEYLQDKGYSQDELDNLKSEEDFWEAVRPLLEKESP